MAITLFFAIGISAIGSASAGPAIAWSAPEALSPSSQSSWFPDIFADTAGQVDVVWSTGISTGAGQAYDVVMYTAAQRGVLWSTPQDIVALPSKGAVTRPAILVDNLGLLHLTYRSYTVYYSHVPVQAVGPALFISPRQISTVDDAYFSRLAIDQLGRLHIVYTENIQNPNCPGCFHVYYRQSDDKGLTWSAPVDISRVATGAAKPQIIIDQADNLHVVWEAGSGGGLGQLSDQSPTQVMYANSFDRGQSWTSAITLAAFPTATPAVPPPTTTVAATPQDGALTPTPLTPTPTAAPLIRRFKNIALGLDGKGQLVVAWLALPEDRVYYQVSLDQGHSWSAPQPIPGVWGAWTVYQGHTDDYAMTTDNSGAVHLVLVGRTAEQQDSLSVLHVAWDDFAWGLPDAITTMTGDVPEWPRASVGLGNDLHVVWFVRDQAHIFDSGGATQYRVWYSHSLLSAPAATPVVWPTLSPPASQSAVAATKGPATPEGNVSPPFTAAATPSPATSPNLVYNELDYLKVVAKGLVPAVLIICVIVGAVLLIRR